MISVVDDQNSLENLCSLLSQTSNENPNEYDSITYEAILNSYLRGDISYEQFVQNTGVGAEHDDEEDENIDVEIEDESPSNKKRRLRAELISDETQDLIRDYRMDSSRSSVMQDDEDEEGDDQDDVSDPNDLDYQPNTLSRKIRRYKKNDSRVD